MNLRTHLLSLAGLLILLHAQGMHAAPVVDSARGTTPIMEEMKPPLIGNEENKDIRRTRAYTMQPPTIPHKIDNYRIDKNFNQCMSCHARSRAGDTQAIPVGATHYMDRAGNMLAQVSPRRYFCTQCHVPQMDVKPIVSNDFMDVDSVIQQSRTKRAGEK